MCSQARGSKCGKTTWDGCGRQAPSVRKGIPQGQHCLRREWVGVDPKNLDADGAGPSSSCTIQ